MLRDSSSSSDESDEDQKKKLKEALTGVFETAEKSKGRTTFHSASSPSSQKASLRPDRVVENDDKHVLNTTPEFRAFVAKKLSEHLDSYYQVSDNEQGIKDGTDRSDKVGQGIKLFRSSLAVRLPVSDTESRPNKRRKVSASSSSSDSEEENARLLDAAVPPEFILKNSSLEIKDKEIQEKSTDRDAASDTEKKKEKKKSKKKKHKTNVLDHEVCNKVKKKKKHKHKDKSDHEHNQEIKVDLTETDLSDKSKR